MSKIIISEKIDRFIYLAISLVAITAISLVLYAELGALRKSIKLLAFVLSFFIFALAGYLMRLHVNNLGASRLTIVALAGFLGMFLSSLVVTRLPSADYATLNYSDGSHATHVTPNQIYSWGRSVGGYFLHPPYENVRVLDSLVGEFSSNPNELSVLFSKPQEALISPNGTPTIGDGVSIEINVFDSSGLPVKSQKYDVSQEDFVKNHWIERKLESRSGISKVQIIVSSGPPGSSPHYDSTLVAFEIKSIKAYMFVFIKMLLRMLLVGFAFITLSLFAFLVLRDFQFLRFSRYTSDVLNSGFPFLLILAMSVTYWSASRTSFVYFWDFRIYWQKTEELYELMISGAWWQAVKVFTDYYSSDYSMLPAVIPAFISLFIGYPTRLTYVLTIVSIYAVPAYIMVAYLAKRLLESGLRPKLNDKRNTWVFSSLTIFLGIPLFFGTTLCLIPDIGGVVLFVAALLCASSLVKAIASEPGNPMSREQSADLLKSSLGVGIFISLMFIFRRWYVFAGVGIVFSCIILVSIESWINRKYFRNVIQRAFYALVLIAFSALPFLSWVLFDWSRTIEQRDYSNLYSGYKNSLGSDFYSFLNVFGLVMPALCLAFILLVRRLNPDRYLLFILVISSLVASLLFLQVQSPSKQHFYLLMPLLGAFLASLSIVIFRRYGLFASVLLSVLLMVGSGMATWTSQGNNWTSILFPQYADWLPKQQPYVTGFAEIARWLILPENEKKKFCVVASSGLINRGVFRELWQVIPGLQKKSFDGRAIRLGEVDSRDGPPTEAINKCEIALVGLPFQSHLRTGEQYSMKIIQEDLITGTGIGSAFNRDAKLFYMDNDTKILAYYLVREITDSEYSNLVDRFSTFKKTLITDPTTAK